ncbi:MAG: T9SS type A sorting domain-containing protein [Flavobacteriales bacterium]|nr:T9SS type A sorting domain-containing protein [Flavobacteriales bacterium]
MLRTADTWQDTGPLLQTNGTLAGHPNAIRMAAASEGSQQVNRMDSMSRRTFALSIALCLGLTTAKAQQAAMATGGDASGIGGTVAYSIGQSVCITHTGATGSVAQGVQQPYEISYVVGVQDLQTGRDVQACPNPTTGQLMLSVGGPEISGLNFQLYDLNGRTVEHRKMTGNTESIRMDHLPSAAYFLSVTDNGKEVRTFKIIKN